MSHSLVVIYSLPLATLMYYNSLTVGQYQKDLKLLSIYTVVNFNYSVEVVNMVNKYVVNESRSTVFKYYHFRYLPFCLMNSCVIQCNVATTVRL